MWLSSLQIKSVEGAVFKELHRLRELDVYPFDELTAIRYEFEVLDKKRREVHQRILVGGKAGEAKSDAQSQLEDEAKRQEVELELVSELPLSLFMSSLLVPIVICLVGVL